VEDGIELGWWLAGQRRSKKRGILDAISITLLDELCIAWDRLLDQWERKYRLLCKFIKGKGIVMFQIVMWRMEQTCVDG